MISYSLPSRPLLRRRLPRRRPRRPLRRRLLRRLRSQSLRRSRSQLPQRRQRRPPLPGVAGKVCLVCIVRRLFDSDPSSCDISDRLDKQVSLSATSRSFSLVPSFSSLARLLVYTTASGILSLYLILVSYRLRSTSRPYPKLPGYPTSSSPFATIPLLLVWTFHRPSLFRMSGLW